MPVLPATWTPGICAEVPVPYSHHRDHHLLDLVGHLGAGDVHEAAGAGGRAGWGSAGGRPSRSSPPRRSSPAAWPAPAPCPIAEEPTARSSPMCSPTGSCSRPRRGSRLGWLKPNRSAIATSRLAPSLAPSGANTELHDTANAFRKRAAAGLAAGVLQRVAARSSPRSRWGTRCPSVTMSAWSAAGGGDDLHRRAGRLQRRERRSRRAPAARRCAGSSPPSRRTGRRARRPRRARSRARSWSCTGWAGTGAAVARTRRPASSVPPGVPGSRSWKMRSSPSRPTLASAGIAAAPRRWRLRPAGIGPTVPTIWPATSGIGEVRSGPCASGVPSLASSVPRGGSDDVAMQPLAGAQPGEQQRVGEVDAGPGPDPVSGTSSVSCSVPHSLVWTTIDTGIASPLRPATCSGAHRRPGRGVAARSTAAGEPALAHLRPCETRVEQRVHLHVIAVMPGGHIARHHRALLVARAH